jgi:tRNA A-37 threonylcarbamoyl transferase component Bud32
MDDQGIGELMDPALRYEIINLISTGDFASVYRARDRELGREVAIKQIHQQYLNDPRQLERYWREAQLLASLQHPNVLTIYDLVRPRGWLILELMRGDLQPFSQGNPIDLDYLRIVLVCSLHALQFLHSNGVIHGDLKPSNLLVDAQNRVKLGDFGLARRASNEAGSLLKGTTKYMAPELVSYQFGPPGPASDLYSLGFTAYELMCGRQFETLFPGLSTFGRDRQIAWLMWHAAPDRHLPEINRVLEGVPPDLARVVQRMVSKDPAHRYQSAQEVLHDLRSSPITTGLPDELVAAAAEKETETVKKKRLLRFGAIGAMVCSLLLCVAMLLPDERKPAIDKLPDPIQGVVRDVFLADRVLIIEHSDTGRPEEVKLKSGDEVLINNKILLFRDLQQGDRVTIEVVRNGEGRRITRILASRPETQQGTIQALEVDEGKIIVATEQGEPLAIRVPQDVEIVFNDQKQLNGNPIRLVDLKVGDQIVVSHFSEETGMVATALKARRVITVDGELRDLDLANKRLTFTSNEAAGKLTTLPYANDCTVTINQRSELQGQRLKPQDLKAGDKVTISHDIQIIRVDAYRVLGQAGVVRAVHESANTLEILLAATERPTRFLINPHCKITLAGEPAQLADLRPGDIVDITHDSPDARNPELLTVSAMRPPDPSRWAILVGIQAYEDNSLSRLTYPTADARLIRQTLIQRYRLPAEQALLLENPSQVRLEQGIAEALRRIKSEDELIVYIAGHAYRNEDGVIYLAPTNFNLSKMTTSGVSLSWLANQLEACSAKRKLLLLDTSNAGTGSDLRIQPSAAELIESLKTAGQRSPVRTMTAIASSSPGERGYDWAAKQQGLFAYCLAQSYAGQADANRDLRIEPSELFAELKRTMAAASAETARTQTPQIFIPIDAAPRLSEEAKQSIRRLAAFLDLPHVDMLDVNLQYAIAKKQTGKEPEPDLLYGMLLMKARQRTEASKHFAQLNLTHPDLLLPLQSNAWIEFEKRTYEEGIKSLERLVAKLPHGARADEAISPETKAILEWVGQLREFASDAVEDNLQPTEAALEKLDAAVDAIGAESRQLYEEGRKKTRTKIEEFDKGIANARDEATRARIRIERRQLPRYISFPFRQAVQTVLASMDQ